VDEVGNIEIAARVDASGLSCPLPIVKAAQAVKGVEPGQVVEVIATDPGSVKDFEAWAKATGNVLVESGAEAGRYRYLLRRS
jgi:tRNA 2-thiouridine synthesizing protein A